MSQLPEMPAAGWPDQGYEPAADPQWQQDTQPDWGGQQQGYPAQQEYQAQAPEYQAQQGYPQQGYPAQQQWAGHAEPTMVVPPQAAAEAESGLPTEFDHLFRDSTPDSRRAIDRQKPAVGGANPGYLNGVQQAEAAPQPAAAAPDQAAAAAQAAQYQAFQQYPQQQAEQYQPDQYQAEQYQGAQYQGGQYAQAEYQQPPGYGGGDFNNGDFNGGGFDNGGPGGGAGGILAKRRPLIIGGAIALVAVIGIVIAMSGGGSATPTATNSPSASSAPKLSAKQQADQIYALIQQSGQLRSDANTAVIDVNGCKNLADAQTALTTTAQKRQAQADGVAKLDVSGIQNGSQLASQLQAAWSASAQYDNAYAQIAGDMQGGCKTSAVKKDSNYKSASQAAGSADTAKSQAAQLWNDNVAKVLGESQVTEAKL